MLNIPNKILLKYFEQIGYDIEIYNENRVTINNNGIIKIFIDREIFQQLNNRIIENLSKEDLINFFNKDFSNLSFEEIENLYYSLVLQDFIDEILSNIQKYVNINQLAQIDKNFWLYLYKNSTSDKDKFELFKILKNSQFENKELNGIENEIENN